MQNLLDIRLSVSCTLISLVWAPQHRSATLFTAIDEFKLPEGCLLYAAVHVLGIDLFTGIRLRQLNVALLSCREAFSYWDCLPS